MDDEIMGFGWGDSAVDAWEKTLRESPARAGFDPPLMPQLVNPPRDRQFDVWREDWLPKLSPGEAVACEHRVDDQGRQWYMFVGRLVPRSS